MYSSSVLLILIFISVIFGVLKLAFFFLEFLSLFEFLNLKRKFMRISSGLQEEASNSNIAFHEKNDIEKAIIKSNKVLDISSIPDFQFPRTDNHTNDDLGKKIECKYEEYIKFAQKSDLKNSNNQCFDENSQPKNLLLFVTNAIREYNCFFSFVICYKEAKIYRKPFLWTHFFGFAVSFYVHILFLSKSSFELDQMVGWIFISSSILPLPLMIIKKISKKTILELSLDKIDSKKLLLIFALQINLIFLLFFVTVMTILYSPNKISTDNICIMLAPCLFIDFLIMRNINLLIVSIFCAVWMKYFKSKSLQYCLKKERLEYEMKDRNFIALIKEIVGNGNEDFSAPSQIISDNCSKLCFGKKNNEIHNFEFIPNISELPPKISEDQM